MRTTSGVRFELRLLRQEPGQAAYEVELAHAGGSGGGLACIEAESGQIAFDWKSEPPPEWCANAVRAQLRTLYRERSAGYPRRVTRWRPGPGAGTTE